MDSSRLRCAATMKEAKEPQHDDELQAWTRGLHRVLCMQGGDDDQSYAKNSDAPASAIALSKPLLVEAINSMKLFCNESSIRIADLGCATGHNTLCTIDLLVHSLKQRYSKECGYEPEFEVFFSDLPSNDFNSLFCSLSSSFGVASRPYYFSGVPGSFYNRLFAKGKLHLAVSLSALHWLSQVSSFNQFQSIVIRKSRSFLHVRFELVGAGGGAGQEIAGLEQRARVDRRSEQGGGGRIREAVRGGLGGLLELSKGGDCRGRDALPADGGQAGVAAAGEPARGS